MHEGFHIHHVDGDHSNNHPNNLALIWGEDHLMLHGWDLRKNLKQFKPYKAKHKIKLIDPNEAKTLKQLRKDRKLELRKQATAECQAVFDKLRMEDPRRKNGKKRIKMGLKQRSRLMWQVYEAE